MFFTVNKSLVQEFEVMSAVNKELKDKNDELELLLALEKREMEKYVEYILP
jgi:hypothetical protein